MNHLQMERHMISIEKSSLDKSLSGSLGIVCFLDDDTTAKAIDIAERVCRHPLDWSLTIPHISLYHAYLQRVDLSHTENILKRISSLIFSPLKFSKIEVFGRKFIFWNLENRSAVMQMHEIALELSIYVDDAVVQRAAKEALNLSQRQMVDLCIYGYPLVKSEFLPNITLGYIDSGISQDELLLEEYIHEAAIKKVQLVEIGEYRSVSTIIEICSKRSQSIK